MGRAGGEITDQAVVRLLRETRQEIEEKLKDSRDYQTQAVKLKLRNKLRQMITEKEGDEDIRAVQASAIMGPEMGLTSEEKNVLARFLRDQAAACKHCCPVRSIFISTYSNTQTFTSISVILHRGIRPFSAVIIKLYKVGLISTVSYFQCVPSQSRSALWNSHQGGNAGCLHNLEKSPKLLPLHCYELNASF